MLPVLSADAEFQKHFDAYENLWFADANLQDRLVPISILCDNAYRRIAVSDCPAHLEIQVFPSLGRFSAIQDAIVNTTHVGKFHVFGKNNMKQFSSQKVWTIEDLKQRYAMNPSRHLTDMEQHMIPSIPKHFDIPEQAVIACQHIAGTTGSHVPVRNIMLRGKSGTGKTSMARIIASILGRPYMLYTCSSDTETFDLIGQPVPAGMIEKHNPVSSTPLPSYDTMVYDPVSAYFTLTGQLNEQVTTQQCIASYFEKIKDSLANQHNQGFVYSPSDLLTALQRGYVIEIQEVASILKPGVMVSLNSLLEQEGCIRLVTGERIVRHPEAIVIMTTNVDYAGLEAINQSVLDRMDLIIDLPDPPQKAMVDRLKAATGLKDEDTLLKMVEVATKIEEYCYTHAITDGVCGFRSLLSWAASTKLTGNAYQSALHTIISKATNETIEQDKIIDQILIPYFPELQNIATSI